MHKLESYITPIILDRLAKYVNIREEDFKMSLWEGEAAFQNLDLRLEALEEQLQLPFEFVSGRLQELTIQIPWSKIMVKPIKIIINTIDIVLKRKELNESGCSTQNRQEENLKVDEAQKGYIANQINKILKNISIQFENIIIKCIEGDIIFSLNIPQLSISSANKKWKEALSDVNPLRKLVHVSDLSVCLDKGSGKGQIEESSEPILNKCYLEIRIIRNCNQNTLETSLTTMVHIFSDSININILSFHYPMILRIIELFKSLKCLNNKQSNQEEQQGTSNWAQSYLAWAWERLPKIRSTTPTVVEPRQNNYLDIGIYIKDLIITLKVLKRSLKEIQINPILGITLKGVFSETLISSQNWFNTKAGTTLILVEPLGYCKPSSTCYFISSKADWTDSYLNGSIFKKSSLEQENSIKEYVTDFDLHLEKYNDAFFLSKGSVMAFDILHIPENNQLQSEKSAESSQRLSVRALLSSTKLSSNASLTTVIDTLKEIIASYKTGNNLNQIKLTAFSLMTFGIPKGDIEVLFGKVQIDLQTKFLSVPKLETFRKPE